MREKTATPEERAAVHVIGNTNRRLLANEFRAFIAAERERCVNKNPAAIPCPKKSCAADIGMPCEDEHNKFFIPCHPERWRAAIRAEPDEKEAAPIWGATARRVETDGEGGER